MPLEHWELAEWWDPFAKTAPEVVRPSAATKDVKETNMAKNEVPELKEAERTSAGLRSALFDELDGLRKGTSNATKANAVAKLCMTIVETVRVELDVAKYAEKHKNVPQAAVLSSPAPLKLGA